MYIIIALFWDSLIFFQKIKYNILLVMFAQEGSRQKRYVLKRFSSHLEWFGWSMTYVNHPWVRPPQLPYFVNVQTLNKIRIFKQNINIKKE